MITKSFIETTISGLRTWVLNCFKKYRSDWEQNDPTAEDYIKNKPFGENSDGSVKQISGKYVEGAGYSDITWTTIVPETTDIVANNLREISYAAIPEEGTVKVVWNGEEYSTEAVNQVFNQQKCIFVGNLSIADMGVDTGEPFVFIFVNNYDFAFAMSNTINVYTFFIEGNAKINHPIRTEFMPVATFYNRGIMNGADISGFVKHENIMLNIGELKYGDINVLPSMYPIPPIFYFDGEWYTGIDWSCSVSNGIGHLYIEAVNTSSVLCKIIGTFDGGDDDNVLISVDIEYPCQPTITGTAGQFVVIGDDGNVTTKTVPSAEGASF